MPITKQLSEAIEAANVKNLDELARTIWKAHASGNLDDTAADRLAEAIEARKTAYKAAQGQKSTKSHERRSRGSKSPDRAKSIARRRSVAMSGAVPSPLAAKFTIGELAVLSLIAQQVQRHGSCDWPMDKLAACAGVCRTTARNAMREAEAQRLITVQERRRSYTRNDTNIIRIVSKEWRTWLRLGGGCKKPPTTDTHIYKTYKQADLALGIKLCSPLVRNPEVLTLGHVSTDTTRHKLAEPIYRAKNGKALL